MPYLRVRSFVASLVAGATLLLVPHAAFAQASAQGDSINAIGQQPGFIQRRPDIAFDATSNVYLSVSANPNLRGRFLNASGTPMGSAFDIDQRGATQQVPRVAWSPNAGSNGAFLVTWLDYQFTDRSQIWGRLVAPGTNGAANFVSPEFLISDANEDVHPEMGAAVSYSTQSQVFLVVYRDGPNFNLRGQRVSNTGTKVGAEIAVTNTPYWEAEPTIAYNPDRDEFLVAYFAEPVDRQGQALTVPVRASDGAVTRAPVAFGGGAFITVPQVEYDAKTKQYLAAYFTYKPGAMFEARWLQADGTPDPNRGLFPIVTGYGSYDGFHLVRNPRTESYLAAFHGLNEDDVAVEVNSAGTPTAPFRATFSCPTCSGINVGRGSGNFNPRIAASSAAPNWFLVASRSFTEIVAQKFVGVELNNGGGSGGGGGGGGGPVPPSVVSNPKMVLDLPHDNSTMPQPFTVAGWAIDLAATTTSGVSRIDVWAFPTAGGAPQFLGHPTYGHARPDVANYFGGSQYTNSGFGSTMSGLVPGNYIIRAFAYSTIAGQFNAAHERWVTLQGNAHMALDLPSVNHSTTPGTTFRVAGWALDLSAATGTGVDTVHVWAFRNPDSAAPQPIFLGIASLGHARPDVRAYFGASTEFTNSGFNLVTSLPQSGTYDIIAFGHSTVSNAFTIAKVRRVTVF
jgi:hypothetical protein